MANNAKPFIRLNRQELEKAWTVVVGQPPPITAPRHMMIEALSDCSKPEQNNLMDASHAPEREPT